MPERRWRAAWAASVALLTASLCLAPSAAAETLYVVRRAWHVDIGFAANDLIAPLAGVGAEYPQLKFLVTGFGDKRYVLARHHGSGTLAAALWPGEGMMLVTGLGADPAQAFGTANVIALHVSADELRSAQEFVWATFTSRADRAARFADGPYPGSLYFAAIPNYSALYTCNTWVADVLRAGGFGVRRPGVIFAAQIWNQAKKISKRQREGASLPALVTPTP